MNYLLCLVMILMAGCASNPDSSGIPKRSQLLEMASLQGKHKASIERYDAESRIAHLKTPGWPPELKPYEFDGTSWIPLWSPMLEWGEFVPADEYNETSFGEMKF